MSEDSNLQLPLLQLFDRLQKAGLPLGIDEYTIALRAIQSGYGVQDYESLARLCRTLWVKSEEDKLLFNYHFEQIIDEAAAQPDLVPIPPEVEPQPKKLVISLPQLSSTHWVVWGGALLLIAGIVLWFVRPQPKKCPYFTSVPPIKPVALAQEYSYEVKACKEKESQNDKLEIKASKKPPWLNIKNNGDGTALLKGKPMHPTYRSVNLWNLSGQQLVESQYGYFSYELLQDLNPKGTYFAFSARNKIVYLRSLSEQQFKKDLQHKGNVNHLSFSPDGQILATASGDGLVYLWDMSGNLRRTLKHKKRVRKVIFSPDGQRIVTVSEDGIHRLWNLSGQTIAELGQGDSKFTAFSSNGQRLMIISFQPDTLDSGKPIDVRLWDQSGREILNKKLQLQSSGSRNQIHSINAKLSPDGNKLAMTTDTFAMTTDFNDRVMLFDLVSDNQPIDIRQANVNSVNFSKDGQHIAIASSDRIVRIWKPFQDPTGTQTKVLRHQDAVNDVIFSPDGNLIATAVSDRTARLWNISGQQLKQFPHNGEVESIKFTADGKRLITTAYNDVHQVELRLTDGLGQIKDTQSFNIPVFREPQGKSWIEVAILGCVTFLIWSGGYLVARYWLERIAKSKVKEIPPTSEPSPKTTPLTPETKPQTEDAVQVVRAVRQATGIETGEYFPVTRRQMKQSWRYLRRFVRSGPPTELDIEATVNQFARQGILLQPALMPRRVNQAELLLLIDRDGSMIPFHELSSRLVETAAQGGRLAKADVYYFHNCVDRYIYQDPSCCEAKLLVDVLADYSNNAGVMIFSDAGAARGGWNQDRIDLTKQFLQQLQQQVRYIAWLNPMPKSRWEITTAGEIASLVPMFELSRQGLQGAIGVLRGKFTPYRL